MLFLLLDQWLITFNSKWGQRQLVKELIEKIRKNIIKNKLIKLILWTILTSITVIKIKILYLFLNLLKYKIMIIHYKLKIWIEDYQLLKKEFQLNHYKKNKN